ncbi:Glycosyltransferase involved in cell wall bisynthesis [Chishuiella changwenlii]|uniref:Alpha-L-Rha alpha-1,3-L-rhamnosyltransferase n=1 Tax=Chishuiella changwenlii TaxID=1434701 RepID=A0A1M7A5E0_9FLAO|nr:glycosyltransferase family 2 protein [Chishuiella changwenlii]GGE91550.1 alpha-L-Rha alpha-1,3-L-rhamnosyltransferase [Chishuiella changwenlii]SHL37875.1 Glycosyltransferase involved in cell wall bisynthesis [Chishuiella changwenlii]
MVSVCITTYNGGLFIKQQLDSIIMQLDENDEIIVSDDGSSDITLQILEHYNDNRIKVLHHKPKKSKYKFTLTTNNFENALREAKGDYIFFADQDDIWENNKVEECLKIFNQGYDAILHDCNIIDQNNEVIINSYFSVNNSKKGIFKNILKNSYLGCCMAINKKYIDRILPFPEESVPHDMWIGIIYDYFGKSIITDKKLISYRRHGNNLSPSGEKSRNSFLFKVLYRIIFIKAFLKRIV